MRRVAPARTAHKPLVPFTVDHYRAYARLLVMDSGSKMDPEDFQLCIAEDLFAGEREVWMVIPEGNGKTTFTGSLALYHADHAQGANVLLAASSRDQCGILLNQAAGFVYQTPGLEKRFRVFEGYRRIRALRTHGRIQVFSADERTGDGEIPTLAILDELHRHKGMRLYRTWGGKLNKRVYLPFGGGEPRQAQQIAISTAGEPGSEFETTRDLVRRSGEVTTDGQHQRAKLGRLVLHDWGLRTGQDPEDLAVVKSSNPLSTITIEKLREKRETPSMTLPHWLRFTCNVAVSLVVKAIGEAEWLRRLSRTYLDIPEGVPIDVGLDLGWKWDATAIVPLWCHRYPETAPNSDGELKPTGLTIERRLFGHPTILTPPRDGENSLEPKAIYDAFEAIHARNPIETVAMDPSAGGEIVGTWLRDTLGCKVVPYEQGPILMSQVAEKFMEEIRAGGFEHVGDPDFSRHVTNAVAYELPSGKKRFDRPDKARNAQGQDRLREIDALIAGAIVLHNSYLEPDISIYETRDMLILD